MTITNVPDVLELNAQRKRQGNSGIAPQNQSDNNGQNFGGIV
jgi:hypothetical protein